MTIHTLGDLIDTLAPDVLSALDRDDIVPITDFARQGDVILIPERLKPVAHSARDAVRSEGVAVVGGEFGGHVHLLISAGGTFFDRTDDDEGAEIGVLRVADGAIAYLLHPEHGGVGILPGRYTVRRQREWDGYTRLVVD